MSYGKNYNIYTDINDLQRMVRALKGYLKGDELYGTLGGGIFTGGSAPNITLGVILTRLRRIEALRDMLDERRAGAFDQARAEHDAVRAAQPERYTAKMEHEANSRLDAMSRFFEECMEDPTACPRIYGPEAFRRTVVQELLTELAKSDFHSEDLDKKVRATDSRLRTFTQEADFRWDEQLAPAYPPKEFWWLYAAPPAQK